MATVGDIYNKIDSIAPFHTAMSFDNVGLLIGSMKEEVKGCIIALDGTIDIVNLAIKNNVNLILTHHPIIFNGLKSIHDNSVVHMLVRNNINVISAHTNLDLAPNGVNFQLANILKLSDITPFPNQDNIGFIGKLNSPMKPNDFAILIKNCMKTDHIFYTDVDKTISTVAIIGGEGSDYLNEAIHSADAYLTGEVKHHILVEAINNNFSLFVIGHHFSEAVVLEYLKNTLEKNFSHINFMVNTDFKVSSI